MEALGSNLENLLNAQEEKKFSLKTVLMIAEQIVCKFLSKFFN